MSRQSHPCPAMQMTLPLVIGGFALAAGAANAHQAGLAAMRQAREDAASFALRGQLDEAIAYTQQLGAYAAKVSAENEQLKAENRRLQALAKQHFETLQAALAH